MVNMSSASIGSSIYAQWFVLDPQANAGVAATEAVHWTIL